MEMRLRYRPAARFHNKSGTGREQVSNSQTGLHTVNSQDAGRKRYSCGFPCGYLSILVYSNAVVLTSRTTRERCASGRLRGLDWQEV